MALIVKLPVLFQKQIYLSYLGGTYHMETIAKIKQLLISKVEDLNRLHSKAEESIEKAPEGSLVLSNCKGTVQYYHKTEREQKKGTYISKKRKKLIKELAQKEYDIQFLKEIERQKKAIGKIY